MANNALLQAYLGALQRRPMLTKAVSASVIASLGNVLSQRIRNTPRVDYRSIASYAIFGLCFNGPITHKFYEILERFSTPGKPPSRSRQFIKLLGERFIFAPLFTLLFFIVVSLLEGKTWEETMHKVRTLYPGAVKMNLIVWTPAQFINLNYIPLQYRVLFANAVAFLWTIYLSKRMAPKH
ncbi:peroxisomal membrane protein 2 [Capsaspora owczarzaki ATCC 30864]|uniref:Peroxisomal membrane protein 2 n=1 Tax=Capsaspora owczarzaki (strain ATCC 30864) TaxID=595528 RepID=A0A0D2X0M3_CAPO3|nr:peroxisomal membrane protein 2 [Capsaspora owczarzaki ATCC 30864]KJE89309.1 peroxisomal membrane protein 2 [Capsaspora owczarzaki ATCC 30864]|eukprot:XP_004365677.1 peroxisomal membrane protein 2 [Capsaspora owczarzaki ATCC 30864]